MIVICGPSCIGKDTLGKYLERYGYEKVRSYTTRPKRDDETLRDYIFISESEFDYRENHDEFFETTKYAQEDGQVWKYGSKESDWMGDTSKRYVILNPEGIYWLDKCKYKYDLIYLTPGEGMEDELRKRYIERAGDDEEERKKAEKKWFTRRTQDFVDFGKFNNYLKDHDPNMIKITINPGSLIDGFLLIASGINEFGFNLYKAILDYNLLPVQNRKYRLIAEPLGNHVL